MQQRWLTITDRDGNALEGATLTVLTYPAGAVATIYSDAAGLAPIPNPLVADADGFVSYYAADGDYTWTVSSNLGTKTITDVNHKDNTP